MTTPETGTSATVLEYRTEPEPTTKMPRCIPYIVANEFAERFSFYGMQAILLVYMTQYMGDFARWYPNMQDREREANIWIHNFNTFVYFTPIIGSLIADIFWGKYRTIFWVSLLYCAGHAVLASGDNAFTLVAGLTLIGMGAGGIKPCVSANVGDQFSKTNEHLLTKVYNWFYFSINLGAFFAQMCIPFLRATYGPRVAFGVPGILMALAAFVFWLGRKQYVHRPPLGWKKVAENFTGENLKILLRLILFFLFVSPFYALYYEGSGSWIAQAGHLDLDLHILGLPPLLQDQVQSSNAILILAFIPLFSYVIYPAIEKVLKVKLTPQKKIGVGMVGLIPAFMIAAYLESQIVAGHKPSVWWQLLAYAIVTGAEIMVSVPALEYAYTQAPKQMKAMIMAAYLAGSISFGNFIGGRVAGVLTWESIKPYVNGQNSPNYYWVFIGLIAAAAVLYVVVSWLMPKRDFVAEEAPSAGV
jgi:proton-dependent oligopeptide transporter, POT family